MEKTTLSNWKTAPFNRWAFQHIDQLIPLASIENNPDDTVKLPTDIRSFHLEEFLKHTATDGFLIMQHGKILYEFYDNGLTAASPHIYMSVTKSITGLVAGMLGERLNREALVTDYVPEVKGSGFDNCTVQDLLDMRTGVRYDEQQIMDYWSATNWAPAIPGAPADLHSFLAGTPKQSDAHGGPFAYITQNTDLLGWVIERAAGQDIRSLISVLLWKPMGADAAAGITVDNNGSAATGGGFYGTLRSLACLGNLISNNGFRNEQSIIPEAFINDIIHGGDTDAWEKGEWGQAFAQIKMRYRNCWYVIDNDPKLIFAMGIHGQFLCIDIIHKIVIAKLSSQASFFDIEAFGLTYKTARDIQRILM